MAKTFLHSESFLTLTFVYCFQTNSWFQICLFCSDRFLMIGYVQTDGLIIHMCSPFHVGIHVIGRCYTYSSLNLF